MHKFPEASAVFLGACEELKLKFVSPSNRSDRQSFRGSFSEVALLDASKVTGQRGKLNRVAHFSPVLLCIFEKRNSRLRVK